MAYIFDQGHFIDERQATISVKNRGLQYGLGFIEGIRAFWNAEEQQLYLFRLEDHYKRFHQSGKILSIPVPLSVDVLNSVTIELMKVNRITSDVYIRPICFKGEELLAPSIIDPYNRVSIFQESVIYLPKPGLAVCVSSWIRNGNNMIPPQAKSTAGYLNSALARYEAVQNGFDEAIFLNEHGFVCEGSTENIFLIKDGVVYTPTIADGILPGITRNTVINIARNELHLEVREDSIARAELYQADELFFTGTAIGIKPIISVDHKPVGNGKPSSFTKQIQQIYELIVRGKYPKYNQYITPVY
ncbi:branched-chain amino acid transaminase [Bacillus kexueae]|uniref:branched-chain amino acid transaminase n=1 Tax=Aeribacillus kexueae TaxID=2078952 RepID=UPI001FAE98FD|nr:branched-chain amino acid transaminase [Bacillus kexueae]